MSSNRSPVTRRHREAGFTFVELIMFVVIVSIGVAGILSVFYATTQKSADPAARKQMIAIAEAMLEEVELMPFTCRDPDDATASDASVAMSGNNCVNGGTMEVIGPEGGETRYQAVTPFDNVNDYNGFDTATATPAGIIDPSQSLAGPAGYRAVVSVTASALGPGGTLIAANDGTGFAQSLLINVTVTSPRGESITLSGYRTRYAPTSPP